MNNDSMSHLSRNEVYLSRNEVYLMFYERHLYFNYFHELIFYQTDLDKQSYNFIYKGQYYYT